MKKTIFLLHVSLACLIFTNNGYSQNINISELVQPAWGYEYPSDPIKGNTFETIVHSQALEDNFVGDSPERSISIYLPPGYHDYPQNRYPVIYLLHGYTQTHEMWRDFPMAETLLAARSIKPVIIVAPNANNKWRGSFYTNSTVNGNWEDFITYDLVDFIDSNFNTLPFMESRGIAGHSMGAYGSIRLVMKHPGVYNAVYSQNNPLLNFSEYYLTLRREETIAAACANSFAQPDFRVQAAIASATAFAPDSFSSPFPGHFPITCEGEMVDSVWEEWLEHDPFTTLLEYKQNLQELGLLALGCGDQDPNINNNNRFSQTLTDSGVSHVYEVYKGVGHNPQTRPILELFSKHLINPIPFIKSKNASFLQHTDSLYVTVDTHATIYIAPQYAGTALDSIISKMVYSDTITADSTLAIPLSSLAYGHYKCYAVSEHGYISNLPVQFSVVPDKSPPILSLANSNVNLGDSIHVSISRDGSICLHTYPLFGYDTLKTVTEILSSSRLIENTDAIADEIISFSTDGLSTSPFWIYGFDKFGIVAGPISVNVVTSSGPNSHTKPKIKLYPNPVQEMVTIQSSIANRYDITIISINGQILYNDRMIGPTHRIDLSSFENGLYFITIRSREYMRTEKIIKQ